MSIITVENRSVSKKAKQLRRANIIPCVIYGSSLPESLMVQMDQSSVKQLLRSKREGSKLEIEHDGKIIPAQIKEIACNFMNNEIQHICFQALEDDKRVNSKAQIVLENTDKIVGILEQTLFEVPYSAFPSDMVDTVVIDLDGVVAGKIFTLEDIEEFKNKDIDVQVSLDTMILRINDKKRNLAQVAE